ncbi:alkaline phosphatase family protein [Parasediminibacterium sp. JCM 36343]|uniref:alkaline phosphatase family protein n=1 Tax=Parasediminibacterium sp. JCM 36343 TaxID=3374279 RepID=UPI00397BEE16
MKQIFTFVILCLFICQHTLAQKKPDHVIIVILENHSYNEIHDSAAAPYINSLFNDAYGAVLTKSYALTHPSQPNYIMLFSGNNQGVINDNLPTGRPFTTANLGASLLQNGYTFTGYSETMPSEGFNGATSGAYARKHNPWSNWQGAAINGIPSTLNQPLTAFPANFSTLPTLSFVIPNLNNDMHDGTVATSDTWIKNNLDSYIQWCKKNNSLFILTFDEDDKSQSNQIVTLFVGQDVKGGLYPQPITHYNLLRTIEDLYGLPYAGASKDSSSIKNIWRTVLPIKLSSFFATKKTGYNTIEWFSATEENCAFFELQSSLDTKTFVSIGKVNATGSNSKYSFSNNNLEPTTVYYRLKIVDKDGTLSYSNVISVNNTFPVGNLFKVSPNPAVATTTLYFNHLIPYATITVYNTAGQNLISTSFKGAGLNKYSLATDKLKKGTYLVSVKTDTENYCSKLVISK